MQIRMGGKRNIYRVLIIKPKENIWLERPRNRWKCNFKRDLKGTGWERADWIYLKIVSNGGLL